jgi:hypothetical protein
MMTRRGCRSAATALPLLFALPLAADGRDQNGSEKHEAALSGYQEVPTLSSAGTATFHARIADDEQSFDWVLSYSGLTNVSQAHIHFGARAISGPIVIFLCTNLTNAPPAPAQPTQACPTSAGTVSGTAQPGDVTGGAAALGIQPGEFAKIIDAIRAGAAYANIHTTQRPAGEIRGQIHSHEDHQ